MANGMEGVSLFVWLRHVYECYIHINASHCPQIDVSFVCAHNCCCELSWRRRKNKIYELVCSLLMLLLHNETLMQSIKFIGHVFDFSSFLRQPKTVQTIIILYHTYVGILIIIINNFFVYSFRAE